MCAAHDFLEEGMPFFVVAHSNLVVEACMQDTFHLKINVSWFRNQIV